MGMGHLRLKWVGHLWLKWVGDLWLEWVGQLWESKLLFFGRYAQKTQVFFTLDLGIRPKYNMCVIAVVGACPTNV